MVCIGIVVWSGLAPTPASANPAGLDCGSVITTDTTLHQDLSDCPADGLVVGADDITVNLNRHTISGDGVPNMGGADFGIRVDGHARVKITNGSVTGFDFDVFFAAAPDGVVHALTVEHSRRGMLFVDHSDGARILGNIATNNGGAGPGGGIVISASSGATIRGNTLLSDHVGVGLANGANGNTVIGNTFTDIPEAAVEISFSDGNMVIFNRTTGSNGAVFLEGANSNTIDHNVVSKSTGPDGIAFSIYGDRNIVTGNTVVDAIRYGIDVDDFQDPGHSPITGNLVRDNVVHAADVGIAIGSDGGGVVLNTRIERNLVTGSRTDGIQLVGPSTGLETSTLTDNIAVHNAQLGINARPGTIDGGGNLAHGNGDPRQCLNISCR